MRCQQLMPNLSSSVLVRAMSLVQPLNFKALGAETRKTYRAVFSEPRLVVPQKTDNVTETGTREVVMKDETTTEIPTPSEGPSDPMLTSKKRTREDGSVDLSTTLINQKISNDDSADKQGRKKKRKRNRGSENTS